jgi:hypothetical protein
MAIEVKGSSPRSTSRETAGVDDLEPELGAAEPVESDAPREIDRAKLVRIPDAVTRERITRLRQASARPRAEPKPKAAPVEWCSLVAAPPWSRAF